MKSSLNTPPAFRKTLTDAQKQTLSDWISGGGRNPLDSCGGFATSFSWGYRLAARADYNSVGGSTWNISPRIAFNHDVNGTTPGAGMDSGQAAPGTPAHFKQNVASDTVLFGLDQYDIDAEARRILDTAIRYATERKAFGEAIANFQLIQQMLADSEIEIYAAECMLDDAARRADAGENIGHPTSDTFFPPSLQPA